MEHTQQSTVSKFMSILFIAMGIFLGIYAFFANAATRTVGTITRDNSNYLSGLFWDNAPTDDDIIRALYGSGDENTAYTQHWTGYNSGSCLNGGMTVEFTGTIPTSTVANTIYVIDSDIYDVTAPITLNDCVALISSGIVTLSGNTTNPAIIKGNGNKHIIIEKIRVDGNNEGHFGIYLDGGMNTTVRDFQAYKNTTGSNNAYGILISGVSYMDIINTQLHNNSNGIVGLNVSNIFMNNVQTYQNSVYGIAFNNINYSVFSGINSNNNTHGVSLLTGSYNNFLDIDISSNIGKGVSLQGISNSSFTNVDSYNNTDHNVSTYNSNNNTFIDITANNSANAMGVYFNNSSSNNLMGIYVYGNYYAGVHFYNSNNNTGMIIVSNSNEGGLYLDDSMDNIFTSINISNNSKNGIVFTSNSSDNTISGAIISGNMGHGVYMSYSDYNTITHSTSTYNSRVGIVIETGTSNNIMYSTFNNNGLIGFNGNGILLSFSSGTIIDSCNLSSNEDNGITLDTSNNTQIINSVINSNYNEGIVFTGSSANIISGSILSGNGGQGIFLDNSNNNNIMNSIVYGIGGWNILMQNSTGNRIIYFSGDNGIIESNAYGSFQYTTYDTYTQNNDIRIEGLNSAKLTGNILSIGGTFPIYFDHLRLATNFEIHGSTSFTISGANRDGTVYIPTKITTGIKLATTGDVGSAQLITTFFDTIEVISGSTYLTMNEGTGTIYYQVLSGTIGQYLSILKSIDGNTWSPNTIDSGCILNTSLECIFSTNGTLKLFSFGTPGLYFTGTTQSGTIITNGGYYNTGIRIAFTGLNISGALLNSTPYTNNALITGDGSYTFVLEDNEGNTTGITFTIDKIKPVFTGTTLGSLISGNVISGGYYNTGITINFNDLYISGAIVSGMNISYYSGNFTDGEIVSSEGTYIFTVYDLADNSTGMIFTIDMTNPSVTANYPTSGLNITGTNNIAFSWTGFDETAISGYTLYVTGSYQHTITTTNTGYTIHTMNNALDYTRYVIITDRAGNTGMSQILPFMITTPLSGQAVLTGTNRYYVTPYRYVKAYASIDLRANQPYKYLVTGSDIVNSITGGLISGHIIVNPQLTGNDGLKTVQLSLENTSGDTVTLPSLSVYLDTTVISPTLSSPLSGASVSGNVVLSRSGVGDAVGISGYRYYVSDTTGFTIIRRSGSTTTTTQATIPNLTLSNGVYYRYVTATDNLGNSGYSTTSSFIYSGILDTTPNTFSFNDIDDADLDETYMSNTITISGLSTGTQVLASITRGMLYISGNAVGTTGYVQNGWTVKIELISSDEYDDSVESTLTIDSKSDTFKVTTKEEDDDVDDDYDDIDTDLSNTEKLIVVYLFETLRDLYAGDKEEEFFNTLMLMLEEKMDDIDDEDDTEWQALKYLYDLADEYYESDEFGEEGIDIMDRINNGVYTAPNGKRYTITYDSATQRFTSTNFVVPKYFPTLDTLKYIIDINNPAGSQYANAKPILARWKNARIDGIWQTSPFTAPNKKVFYFFKDINGRYSSYTFTSERYFSSLDDVKEFIYNSNKK